MNETLQLIHGLHTTRANQFSDRQVSDQDLQTIIKASVRAANASNRQSYSIIVVDDETLVELNCLNLDGVLTLWHMVVLLMKMAVCTSVPPIKIALGNQK